MLIAWIGASLGMDRSANNWPQMMLARLRVGKQPPIQFAAFGKEGAASSYWLSAGWVERAAAVRPDIVLYDVTPDANPGQGVSLAQSLANMYAAVDAVQAKNANAKVFLCTMNHMRSDATQFANVTNYYAQIDTVIANRSNVAKIDCYTAWGDPSLYPAEYSAGDPIHPLLAGNLRVTVPVVAAALSPLIT